MAKSGQVAEGGSRQAGRPKIRVLKFDEDTRFQKELHRRVEAYFEATGRRKHDCWQMYLKSAIIMAALIATYVLLVFVVQTLWMALLLSVALGLCMAGVGFNIQHDGGHQAYSRRKWINRLAAWTLDLVGSSSGRWHWKHAVIHHRYVNITGYDQDVDLGGLGRLTPHQKRRRYQRWQHLYLWMFYGLLAVKMQLVDDFRYVITGRLGENRVPRPTGRELVVLVLGKAIFLAWIFVIPMLLHPIWAVLLCYAVAAGVSGVAMTLVFIVPHLVDKADFPAPVEEGQRMDAPWAVHQARVTVDFAQANPVITWLVGGLNYHKEHHLFPLICHINYPGMSKVVEQTCREFGVPYHRFGSFRSGIAAHFRWLRHMATQRQGQPDPEEARDGHEAIAARTSTSEMHRSDKASRREDPRN